MKTTGFGTTDTTELTIKLDGMDMSELAGLAAENHVTCEEYVTKLVLWQLGEKFRNTRLPKPRRESLVTSAHYAIPEATAERLRVLAGKVGVKKLVVQKRSIAIIALLRGIDSLEKEFPDDKK